MSASASSACCWPAEHPLCRCRRADAVTDACYQEMRSFKRTLNNADPAQDGFVPAAVFAAQVNVYATA